MRKSQQPRKIACLLNLGCFARLKAALNAAVAVDCLEAALGAGVVSFQCFNKSLTASFGTLIEP